MYSYDRMATGSFLALKAMTPRYLEALKKAWRDEQDPDIKECLKDALFEFNKVLDRLKDAEAIAEEAMKE